MLESDFDRGAFQSLEAKRFRLSQRHVWAGSCLHQTFSEKLVRQGGKTDLLAAGGILSAAKEQESCNRLGQVKANGNVTRLFA